MFDAYSADEMLTTLAALLDDERSRSTATLALDYLPPALRDAGEHRCRACSPSPRRHRRPRSRRRLHDRLHPRSTRQRLSRSASPLRFYGRPVHAGPVGDIDHAIESCACHVGQHVPGDAGDVAGIVDPTVVDTFKRQVELVECMRHAATFHPLGMSSLFGPYAEFHIGANMWSARLCGVDR